MWCGKNSWDKLTTELGTELGIELGTELETDFGILVIFFTNYSFFKRKCLNDRQRVTQFKILKKDKKKEKKKHKPNSTMIVFGEREWSTDQHRL